MGLALHKWYPPEEILAAFGEDAASESYCDGQFVVFPKVVLCLATLGDRPKEPHVPCPSTFVWHPRRLDYEPSEEMPWLPERVREVFDRSQKEVRKLRDHHVFLRIPPDEEYFYAGQAHLGSYGGYPGAVSADFYLKDKLPRDVWLRFGGYPGWLVQVNHRTHRVADGDLATFEQLANELPKQEFSHLVLTRYEEDSLTIHTNRRRGWLMYLRHRRDHGVYTRDLQLKPDGDSEPQELFRCFCGIDLEFPAVQTLPRELAMRAVIEYFLTGRLPKCVHWDLDQPEVPN